MTTTALIRNARAADFPSIAALNAESESFLSPMNETRLERLHGWASYHRLIELDGKVAAFLLAFREGAGYDSPNYRWFSARYESFVYIDRVVVGNLHRGHGLGRLFYSDVQSYAEVRSPNLACEVFLEPRDDVSVLFHGVFGFHELGQQVMPESGRRVSLLVKPLDCHAFVRETYPDGLPGLAWLAARTLPTDVQASLRVAGQA